MNQEIRNKKNAKYQQNLQKRYGITKSSDYKTKCYKGISLSDRIKPMTKEFVTTRRHGIIVSKEVYTYKWTPEAIAVKKEIAKTPIMKDFITTESVIDKKRPTIAERQKGREQRKQSKNNKENIPFSPERNKFFGTPNNYLKKAALKAAHEKKIKELTKQLQERKMSIRLRNYEQRPFKVVISTIFDPEFKVSYSRMKLNDLHNVVTKLHEKLSAKYDTYKSIAIVERATNEKKLLYAKKVEEHEQAA